REQIVARILDLPDGTAYSLLAPVVRGQKGEYKDLFADLGRAGYVRARVNGQVVALTDDLALDRQIKHNIEVVIDRLKAGPSGRSRRWASGGGTCSRGWPPTSRPTPMAPPRARCSRAPGATSTRAGGTPGSMAWATA